MDLDQYRELYRKQSYKIELSTERFLFSVMLPWNFSVNRNGADFMKVLHTHIRYEILTCWEPKDPGKARFVIIPPGIWHRTKDYSHTYPQTRIVSFQIGVSPRNLTGPAADNGNAVLENLLRLEDMLELPDNFDGIGILEKICQELERGENARYPILFARFQLLLMELCCALPNCRPELLPECRYSTEDFRPEIIESFFVNHHGDADCSREHLAAVLRVSERQLVRIIERMYNKTFQQVLNEHRMEFARALADEKELNADACARKVGYQTTRGFLLAYEKYHGTPYPKIK